MAKRFRQLIKNVKIKRPKLTGIKRLSPEEAYRNGLRDGSNRLQYRLKLLATTNYRLWEELTTLDRIEPIDNITISIDEAKKIIFFLNRGTQSTYFAKKLNQKVKEYESVVGKLTEQFCEEAQDDSETTA